MKESYLDRLAFVIGQRHTPLSVPCRSCAFGIQHSDRYCSRCGAFRTRICKHRIASIERDTPVPLHISLLGHGCTTSTAIITQAEMKLDAIDITKPGATWRESEPGYTIKGHVDFEIPRLDFHTER